MKRSICLLAALTAIAVPGCGGDDEDQSVPAITVTEDASTGGATTGAPTTGEEQAQE